MFFFSLFIKKNDLIRRLFSDILALIFSKNHFFIKKKKLVIFLCIFYFFYFPRQTSAQNIPLSVTNIGLEIKKAESFFEEKKYTEALRVYERVFQEGNTFSPRMLFQMGFIYEGLGDYTRSLYFLNLYYQHEPSWQLLQHIEAIAQRHRLKGYSTLDQDFVLTFYYQYFNVIWVSLILFCGLLSGYIFWYEWQGNVIALPRKIILLFCLGIFFVSSFWFAHHRHIIISEDQSYLMSAPSASSEVVKVVNKGHKLYAGRSYDIWQEVYWDNQKVYIRKTNIFSLKF